MQDVSRHDHKHESGSTVNPAIPVILGVVGAGLSALAAYAIAKRQRSGKIDTTEAETLWAEGQSMRQELRAETIELRQEIVALRAEAVAARNESSSMRVELSALREESIVTHTTMATLREECAALSAEIVSLREQMTEEQTGRKELGDKLDKGESRQP